LSDSDGQFPIENLEAFLKALSESPARAYIGVRSGKRDTLFARFGSWASGAACNLCCGTSYRDFNSACKLVDGSLLRWLPLEAKGQNYSTELTARLIESGFPPVEVAIAHLGRRHPGGRRLPLRGAAHRLLFVCYLYFRRMLLALNVLQSLSEREDRPYA
jgi:hypothetical protein